jgi:hypothetical protein
MSTPLIRTGNAVEDGQPYRGWLVGHFVDPAEGIRRTAAVEVRWTLFLPARYGPSGFEARFGQQS